LLGSLALHQVRTTIPAVQRSIGIGVVFMLCGCGAGHIGESERSSAVVASNQAGANVQEMRPDLWGKGTFDPADFTIALHEARDAGTAAADAHGGAPDAAMSHDAGVVVPDAGVAQDASVACTPPATPSGDGHSADYDCMSSGCHGPGVAVAGLLITVSGTLHDNANGGTPVAGATVYVTDSTGQTLALVTSANGIFWSGSSNGQSVPAGPQGTCASGTCTTYAAAGMMRAVSVSKCPDAPRSCPTPNDGECANCHSAGSGTQQSVHLP
jgi:hypothetical protein